MKSVINITYSEHKGLDNKPYYVGWDTDYTAVVVRAESLEQLEVKILKSLKVLFLHFIDIIDDESIETSLLKIDEK